MLRDPRYAWLRQLAAFVVVLAIWEAADRADMLNPMYAPSPSRIPASRIAMRGAVPQPRRAFERGQWATGTSSAASV